MTISPTGGKVGSTVEVTFSGGVANPIETNLEEPDALIFSHPGIKAEPVLPADPSKPDPKKPPMPNAKPAVTRFKVTPGTAIDGSVPPVATWISWNWSKS